MEVDIIIPHFLIEGPFGTGLFPSWICSSLPPPVRQRLRPWQRAVFCFIVILLIHHSDFRYSVRIWSSFLNMNLFIFPRHVVSLSHGDNNHRGHPTSCGSNILPHNIGSSFSSNCPCLFYLSPVPPFILFIVPLSSRNSVPSSLFKLRSFPMLSGLDMNFWQVHCPLMASPFVMAVLLVEHSISWLD